MMTAAPAPRWTRRPDARPDELLAAALEVFGEQGYVRARLEDVARRAGVSKGTIYLYFDNKEALFKALVRSRVSDALVQARHRLALHQGPWREALVTTIRAMWRVMNTDRMCVIGRLVQSELEHVPEIGRFYFDEVIAPGRQLLRDVLDRGIAAGEFEAHAAEIAPRAIPAMLLNLAATRRYFAQHEPDLPSAESVLDGALTLVLHGLERRPAAGAS